MRPLSQGLAFMLAEHLWPFPKAPVSSSPEILPTKLSSLCFVAGYGFIFNLFLLLLWGGGSLANVSKCGLSLKGPRGLSMSELRLWTSGPPSTCLCLVTRNLSMLSSEVRALITKDEASRSEHGSPVMSASF